MPSMHLIKSLLVVVMVVPATFASVSFQYGRVGRRSDNNSMMPPMNETTHFNSSVTTASEPSGLGGATASVIPLPASTATTTLSSGNSTTVGKTSVSATTPPVTYSVAFNSTATTIANPGGPLTPARTSIPPATTMLSPDVTLIFTTVTPTNPGGPLSPILTTVLPGNPGGPLSPASYVTGGALNPIPKILPVYSPGLLGNAYGGGFVITPSVFAVIYPDSTSSARGVPPGYGYSLQPGQTVTGNSIVEVGTTSTTTNKDKSTSTTSAKDKTGLPDSIPTSAYIPGVGLLTPSGNYTPSTPTLGSVQPFEGMAGRSNIGEAMALLGFLALLFLS